MKFFYGIVILGCLCIGQSVSAKVIYETDFSSNPEWVTDDADANYWDEDNQYFILRTKHRLQSQNPDRYVGIKTELDPAKSFQLTWKQKFISGSSTAIAPFGLISEKYFGISTTSELKGGYIQAAVGYIQSSPTYHSISILGAGSTYDLMSSLGSFSFYPERWYEGSITYDAELKNLRYQFRDTETDEVLIDNVRNDDGNGIILDSSMRSIGVSMYAHAEVNRVLDGALEGSYVESAIDDIVLEELTPVSSVLFLPGFQASRLYKEGIGGTEDTLWEPNGNSDVAELSMDVNGVSVNNIYTNDIIDRVGKIEIYDSLITLLDDAVSDGDIAEWEAFSYDWRKSAESVVEMGSLYPEGVRYPTEILEEMAQQNGGSVTIIAHSNGGLVAKSIMERLKREGKENLVNRIIFIATPHLGTPKAIGSILHGYEQGFRWKNITLVDENTVRESSRNMPGAYGLVPSGKYISSADEAIVRFDDSTSTKPLRDAYGTTIDSEIELLNFMTGQGDGRGESESIYNPIRANESLLSQEFQQHENILDNWLAPSHVTVTEIVGVGLETVNGFVYEEFSQKECSLGFINCVTIQNIEAVPQFTLYGDGTVVAQSARSYPGSKEVYFVDLNSAAASYGAHPVKHADITRLPEVQTLIRSIITNSPQPERYISTQIPQYDYQRDIISIHSPATLSIIDANNRKVGRSEYGELVYEEIPNSMYFELGNSKYAIVPSNQKFKIYIEGEGEEGTYTLLIDQINRDLSSSRIQEFKMATVTPQMLAVLSKSEAGYEDLMVDYDRNGTVDEIIRVASGSKPITKSNLYAELKATISALSLLKLQDRNKLLRMTEVAEQFILKQQKFHNKNSERKILNKILNIATMFYIEKVISPSEYNKIRGYIDAIMKL